MIEAVMEGLIEGGLQFVGWTALKVLTFGRYQSSPNRFLLEGAIGFAVIAGAGIGSYALM